MNALPKRSEPKTDAEIVLDLIDWSKRWDIDKINPTRLGKARRTVHLWDIIESAKDPRRQFMTGQPLYHESPTPLLQIMDDAIAGTRFTKEDAEKLCAKIMERATLPSVGQNPEHQHKSDTNAKINPTT